MFAVLYIGSFHVTHIQSVVALMLCGLFILECYAKAEDETVKDTYSVEAVLGGLANLPCDITPPEAGDKMHILIWYKEKSPIYTFDSRDKKLEQGKHWSDELVLGGRAYFRYQEEPAKLTLDSVKESDGGVYHCRVDFRRSPTRNVVVNLTVIIPPEKLSVLNERGAHIPHYILGPYNEGASINITCVATGGRPSPKVTWWQENALLDDSYEYLSERRVRNILHLDRLERKHLHSVFTCQSSNNNLVTPISSSVTLDMNLRPLWVKLLGTNKPLSAENTYELSCEVVGSRPAPTITWWKGSVQMTDTRETTSPDSNTTTSVLTLTPSADDGGKYLSCRGQQSLIPNSAIEDGWRLDIYHIPLVTLELGSNLNARTVREGIDVYFECNIKSNPWVYKVSWKHNGRMLYNNGATGTIVSNQSLVLQSVSRARAGTYTCIGSNHEGDGESNAVQLDVKFSPLCRPGQQKVYNVARQETVAVHCELEANPTNIQFFWKFNNSDNSALMLDMPQNLVTVDKTKSILLYTPMTEHDYGTLLCKGTNKIGQQRDPCVFYINPAGKPDPLSNCSVVNQTVDSIQVECVEGFDGGLPQTFVLEVYDSLLYKLISNVSARNPDFFIAGLAPDTVLDIVIYATNKKGKSEIRTLQTFTLKSVEKRSVLATTSVFLQLTPILGALIGIVITLILVATIIVVVIRLRGSEDSSDKNYDSNSLSASGSAYAAADSKNSSTEPLRTDLNGSVNSLEEKNPDIIPLNNSEEDYLDEERAFERLNNVQPRTYIRLPTPNQMDPDNSVRYDVLESNKNQPGPHLFYSQQPASRLQPFGAPHSSTLQRMQHPHLLPAYIPRTTREMQHTYDGTATSTTPLISRENNALHPILIASGNRTPTISTSQSHIVTRF